MKPFVYTAWLVTAALVLLAGGLHLAGVMINTTPSMPRGLWRVHAAAPVRGSVVLICPPDTTLFRRARTVGVVPPGRCRGDYEPLLKRVVAVAGDDIRIDGSGLTVNAMFLAGPPIVTPSLPDVVPAGRYHVPPGDLWLVSLHPRSWDSRHFGPLSTRGLLGIAEPVFTEGQP